MRLSFFLYTLAALSPAGCVRLPAENGGTLFTGKMHLTGVVQASIIPKQRQSLPAFPTRSQSPYPANVQNMPGRSVARMASLISTLDAQNAPELRLRACMRVHARPMSARWSPTLFAERMGVFITTIALHTKRAQKWHAGVIVHASLAKAAHMVMNSILSAASTARTTGIRLLRTAPVLTSSVLDSAQRHR